MIGSEQTGFIIPYFLSVLYAYIIAEKHPLVKPFFKFFLRRSFFTQKIADTQKRAVPLLWYCPFCIKNQTSSQSTSNPIIFRFA